MKLATIAVVLALSCSAAPACSDDFADFRVPTHRLTIFSASLSASERGGRSGGGWSQGRDSNLDGAVTSRFIVIADGDTSFRRMDLSVGSSGARSRSSGATLGTGTLSTRRIDHSSWSRSAAESWSASLEAGRYFGGTPFHGMGALSSTGSLGQYWHDRRLEELDSSAGGTFRYLDEGHGRSRRTSVFGRADLSFGVGRVRDVTSVQLAHVVEQRLSSAGALSQPLSRTARQQLVALIALSGDYGLVRARPGSTLWAEIARVLGEDGALSDAGLAASSGLRAGEPVFGMAARMSNPTGLPDTRLSRTRGWRCGFLLRGQYERRTLFLADTSHARVWIDGVLSEERFAWVVPDPSDTWQTLDAGVRAEWHRPLGWRGQLDASASLTTPLRTHDDGFETEADVRFGWEIADRWIATADVSQSRRRMVDARTGISRRDDWAVAASGGLGYAVADHVELYLRASANQSRNHAGWGLYPPALQRGFVSTHDVQLGLTYRFVGRFVASGFPALAAPGGDPDLR